MKSEVSNSDDKTKPAVKCILSVRKWKFLTYEKRLKKLVKDAKNYGKNKSTCKNVKESSVLVLFLYLKVQRQGTQFWKVLSQDGRDIKYVFVYMIQYTTSATQHDWSCKDENYPISINSLQENQLVIYESRKLKILMLTI